MFFKPIEYVLEIQNHNVRFLYHDFFLPRLQATIV